LKRMKRKRKRFSSWKTNQLLFNRLIFFEFSQVDWLSTWKIDTFCWIFIVMRISRTFRLNVDCKWEGRIAIISDKTTRKEPTHLKKRAVPSILVVSFITVRRQRSGSVESLCIEFVP
jgi:hypothetical protein